MCVLFCLARKEEKALSCVGPHLGLERGRFLLERRLLSPEAGDGAQRSAALELLHAPPRLLHGTLVPSRTRSQVNSQFFTWVKNEKGGKFGGSAGEEIRKKIER